MFDKCNFIRFKSRDLSSNELDKIMEIPFSLIRLIERSSPGMLIVLKDGTKIATIDESIEFITERVSDMVIRNIVYKETNSFNNYDLSDQVRSLLESYRGRSMSEITMQDIINRFKSLLFNNRVLITGSIVALANPLDNSVTLALTKIDDLRMIERVGISLPVYYNYV